MRYSGILLCSIIPGIVSVLSVRNNRPSFSVPAPISYYQNKVDSADMIIDNYMNALGGEEKLESIHSIYMEGSLLVRGQKITSKTWIVNNTASRNESINSGFTQWSIVHTDSAWSYNPRRGQKAPEPWPKDRIKIGRFGLDIPGPLVDYKKKGYKVEYKGIEQIEGSDTYKIEEKLNDTITKTFYIDLDSYLIVRERSRYTTPNRVSYSNTDYSDYKKTGEGYVFPMEIGNLKYTSITVNPTINNKLFIPTK
ncbi:MAG TPA: hypothetical protein VK809_10185 [Bacteroidia bacterium]|jgi:hypothetical protein|nr:hypothetical protein [Bacteroidia bacterium]